MQPRQSDPSGRMAGFTLIEVLVAFVLLSLSLAVILQIFSSNLRNAGSAGRYGAALVLAETKLAELGREIPLQPATLEGEERQLSWQLAIAPYQDPALEPYQRPVGELLEVRLRVSWRFGGREPVLELRTLRTRGVDEG